MKFFARRNSFRLRSIVKLRSDFFPINLFSDPIQIQNVNQGPPNSLAFVIVVICLAAFSQLERTLERIMITLCAKNDDRFIKVVFLPRPPVVHKNNEQQSCAVKLQAHLTFTRLKRNSTPWLLDPPSNRRTAGQKAADSGFPGHRVAFCRLVGSARARRPSAPCR